MDDLATKEAAAQIEEELRKHGVASFTTDEGRVFIFTQAIIEEALEKCMAGAGRIVILVRQPPETPTGGASGGHGGEWLS